MLSKFSRTIPSSVYEASILLCFLVIFDVISMFFPMYLFNVLSFYIMPFLYFCFSMFCHSMFRISVFLYNGLKAK